MIAPEGYIPLLHLYEDASKLCYEDALSFMHETTHSPNTLIHCRTDDLIISWFEEFYKEHLFIVKQETTPIRLSHNAIIHRFFSEYYFHERSELFDQFRQSQTDMSMAERFCIASPIPSIWLNRPENPLDAPAENEWETFKAKIIHELGGARSPLFICQQTWTLNFSLLNTIVETQDIHKIPLEEETSLHASHLKRFEGYSLCIPQEYYDRNWATHWDQIGDRKLTEYRMLALNEDQSSEDTSNPIGRPRKQEIMAECYNTHFPDGHAGYSWKKVLNEIEAHSGIRGSVETLKRGLKNDEK